MYVLIAYLLGILTGVKQIDPTNEAKKSQNYRSDSPPILGTEPNIPTALKFQNRKQYGLELYLAFIHTLTMFAVIWYAVINSHMLDKMKESTDAANKSAGAAQISAEVAELSERPWIKILGIQAKGNKVILGMNFSGYGHGVFPNGRKQINIPMDVSFTNIGHSVAEVYVDYELFLPLWESQGPTSHGYSIGYAGIVAQEKTRYCNFSSKNKEFPVRFVIFPNEPFTWSGGISQPILPDRINHIEQSRNVVLPVVIVCVNYRIPGSPKIYQTSALYEAFRTEDRSRFFPEGKDVPSDKFFLVRNESEDEAR
jgi:hypothetical protein